MLPRSLSPSLLLCHPFTLCTFLHSPNKHIVHWTQLLGWSSSLCPQGLPQDHCKLIHKCSMDEFQCAGLIVIDPRPLDTSSLARVSVGSGSPWGWGLPGVGVFLGPKHGSCPTSWWGVLGKVPPSPPGTGSIRDLLGTVKLRAKAGGEGQSGRPLTPALPQLRSAQALARAPQLSLPFGHDACTMKGLQPANTEPLAMQAVTHFSCHHPP